MADDNNDKANEGLQKKLDKANGDAMAVCAELWADNFRFREQAREAKQKLDDAEKKLPAEGAVVLSKTDAERWKVYQELGKPEDLKAIATERDTLKGEVAQGKRDSLLREVADVEGWNYSVIKRLGDGLEFEIAEGKDKEGKATKYANVVIVSGDKKESKTAQEFAEKEWAEFIPALAKTDAERAESGTRYVKQPGNDNKPPQTKDEVVKATAQSLRASGQYQM